MPSLNKAADLMVLACDRWSLGYSQPDRNQIWDGGNADCSSLVEWALRNAGFATGIETVGSWYTGNAKRLLTARGWAAYPYGSISNYQIGDVLLSENYHIEMWVGDKGENGPLAGAMIAEDGSIDGYGGDQTGRETSTHPFYNYPWDYVLRYNGGDLTNGGDEDLQADERKALFNMAYAVQKILEGPETNSDQFIAEMRNWRNKVDADLAVVRKQNEALASSLGKIGNLAGSIGNGTVSPKDLANAVRDALAGITLTLGTP